MTPVQIQALALSAGRAPTANQIAAVAEVVGPEAAAWAFTQWELRSRASVKFGRASEMLFVRDALEQATHERVAEWRARRFPPGAPVVDLTCGIGSDLIALAARGPAVGIDTDPERVACARHNLAVFGLEAEVQVADCLTAEPADFWVADPARRDARGRTLDLARCRPDPRAVVDRHGGARLAALKLSPLLADRELHALGPRVEFVSFGRECREACVWLGREAVPGRAAHHVESGETLASGAPPPQAESPLEWLVEADPAATRAGALGTLAEEHGLSALGDAPGWLTAPRAPRSPWLRVFPVLEFGKGSPESALRSLGAGPVVVKTRGVDIDPARKARELSSKRGEPRTVAFYSVRRSVRWVVLDEEIEPQTV
ncbi:MAG: hypothetical protein SNJ74_03275 [Fimbriimonadaceae bacterium]